MTMEMGARMAQSVAAMKAIGAELAEATLELGLASVELEYDSSTEELTFSGYDRRMKMVLGFTMDASGGGADE